MNIVSKKLHALEKNVLPELPEEGTTKITWENGDIELDRAENELHIDERIKSYRLTQKICSKL